MSGLFERVDAKTDYVGQNRVEHSLIALISEETQPSSASHQVQEKSLKTGLGPQANASSDSVASQADVDDLLSSLGF